MDEDVELAKQRLGSVVGGRWTLEQVLGAGGVGAVYRARDTSGELAAIKILHAALAHKQDVKERFLREGVLANKVAHDGALKIWAYGSTPDGAGYLVMELLEGETLTQLLQMDGPIGVKQLFSYIDQVLGVLMVAHGMGIIHRDLKPDNLFITTKGQLKVLDFGLARRLADIQGDFKTKTGLALGTIPYMAPEQALGRRGEVDGRVDIFALGAMAFRILARRKIHEADSEAELLVKMASTPAPPLRQFAPHVPLPAQQVVDMALAFSKDARYPDAQTMQDDVRAVLAGHPPFHAQARLEQLEHATRLHSAPVLQPENVRPVAPTRPLGAHQQRTEPMPVSQKLVPSPPAPNHPAPLAVIGVPVPAAAVFHSSPGYAATTPAPAPGSSRKWWLIGGLGLVSFGTAAAVGLVLVLPREAPIPPPEPAAAGLVQPLGVTPTANAEQSAAGLASKGLESSTLTPTKTLPAKPVVSAVVNTPLDTNPKPDAPPATETSNASVEPNARATPNASPSSRPRAQPSAPRTPAPKRRAPLLSRPGE